MNTDLMEIADMNTAAVAYYCHGYSAAAIETMVTTLTKLSEIKSLELIKQKEQRTRIRFVSDSNDTAIELNGLLNKVQVSDNTNQYLGSDGSDNRYYLQNQVEERPILISASFPVDRSSHSGYTISLTSVCPVDEHTQNVDYDNMIIEEDPWTYGEVMFYAGRTQIEYMLATYSIQPGSTMMSSIELLSTNQSVHDFTSPTYANTFLLDSYVGLYDAAFLLTNDIPYSYEETAGVVSFNLALVLHRDAIIGANGNDTKLFLASLRLYQQALVLLGQDNRLDFVCILTGELPPCQALTTSGDMSSRLWYQQSVTMATLAAAIYCNIANIYCRSEAEPKRKIVLIHRLGAIIRFLVTENGTTKEDMSFFHMTFSSLMASLKNPSPAA